MNKANKEQLSAFMDDELDGMDDNQVGQMLKDPEALEVWSRYHLISDGLRRSLPEHPDQDLAGKVSAAVAQEPAIVAPIRRRSRSFARPAAGFAIAASVAMLAILGVQQQQQGARPGLLPDTLVQSAPDAGGANVYAPVRQVSAGRAAPSAECTPQARENARKTPAAVQHDAARAQSGRNCP